MLWKLYLKEHPNGYGDTQFHTHFTIYTGRARPVSHLEHKAGDKMYIDFAGERLCSTDKDTGEVQFVEVFLASLGCSQLTYVEAVATQRREDFIAYANATRLFAQLKMAKADSSLIRELNDTAR